MSDDRFTVEHSARIYHDDYGYFIEVGHDNDGLECCLFTYDEGDGSDRRPFVPMSWEMAEQLAQTILTLKKLKDATDARD